MATRIKEKYLAEAIPALEEKFGYKNAMQVPKLAKIVTWVWAIARIMRRPWKWLLTN